MGSDAVGHVMADAQRSAQRCEPTDRNDLHLLQISRLQTQLIIGLAIPSLAMFAAIRLGLILREQLGCRSPTRLDAGVWRPQI